MSVVTAVAGKGAESIHRSHPAAAVFKRKVRRLAFKGRKYGTLFYLVRLRRLTRLGLGMKQAMSGHRKESSTAGSCMDITPCMNKANASLQISEATQSPIEIGQQQLDLSVLSPTAAAAGAEAFQAAASIGADPQPFFAADAEVVNDLNSKINEHNHVESLNGVNLYKSKNPNINNNNIGSGCPVFIINNPVFINAQQQVTSGENRITDMETEVD